MGKELVVTCDCCGKQIKRWCLLNVKSNPFETMVGKGKNLYICDDCYNGSCVDIALMRMKGEKE